MTPPLRGRSPAGAGTPGGARGGPATEASLLARAKAGDIDAFEQLSGAYADRLFMLLLRLLGDPDEAGEVAQEVMLRAWRGISRFQGRSSYFTWLYRIAVNEANRALEAGAAPGERPDRTARSCSCRPLPRSTPPGRPRTASCARPWPAPW